MALIITIILIWLIVLTVKQNALKKRIYSMSREITPTPDTHENKAKQSIQPKNKTNTKPTVKHLDFNFGSLEKLLTEKIFTKIGALSLIIATGLLINYAFEHNLINDYIQIALGYSASIGFIVATYKVVGKYIQQALFGVGFSGFYAITFAGYSFYHVLPLPLATALILITVGFTIVTSLRYNSQVIAILGLAGAYLVPILLGEGNDITIFLAYITILNLVGAFLYYKKSWIAVSILNQLATFTIFWHLLIILGLGENTDFIFYFAVWLTHFAAHFMQNSEKEDLAQITNFGLFTIIALCIDNTVAVTSLAIAGLAYLTPMALDVAKKQTFKLELFYSSATFILFISSAFSYFNNNYYLVYAITCLAIVAFALALFCKKEYFMFIAIVVLGAAFTCFATKSQIFVVYKIADFTPLINQRALILLGMIALAGIFTFVGIKQKLEYEDKFKSLSLCLLSLIAATFALTEINDISRMLMQQHKFSYSVIKNYQHLSEIFVILAVTINLFRWGYQYTVTRFTANFGFSIALIYLFLEGFNNAGMLIPALNFRVLVWLIFVGILAKAACKSKNKTSRYATYSSLSLATILIWSEVDLFSTGFTTELLISVTSLIFGALTLFVGAKKGLEDIRYFATALIVLIIAKVFFIDLSHLGEAHRIISSGFLGAILLAVSYYYSKINE